MVRMSPTATPGALVLAFHFRCYTTDSNKRWELCHVPICAPATPANGKYSYILISSEGALYVYVIMPYDYPADQLKVRDRATVGHR